MKLLKSLPPGVPFLFRLILIVSAPPSAVYLLARIAENNNVVLPFWTWGVAAALSGPLILTARIRYKYYSFRVRAARMGAVLPPCLDGKEFGNFDILRGIIEAFKNGYPCTFYPDWGHQCSRFGELMYAY